MGYIGLPTAAMFASKKIKVIGVDVNQDTVDTINRGDIHIVEPDLDIIVKQAVIEGYLEATIKVRPADAFLIAVPTPFKNSANKNPEPDLKFIKAAAKSIATVLKKGDLVILESTSPVGATEELADLLEELRPDLTFPHDYDSNADINIAHCPERVLPGHVVRELVENDRVIGGISHKCSSRAIELYKNFVKGECFVTNARTAEMAKLTENACRDVQIAFANELSVICDGLNIDVWELISLANRHPRIDILQPGPGVGGHCIAVDPWFIVSKSPNESKLIKAARQINDSKSDWVVEKVKSKIKEYLTANQDLTPQEVFIACYGLAFKANIDDLRESPSMKIAQEITILNKGKTICVEPNISSELQLDGIFLGSLHDTSNANIHVLLVEHKEFKEMVKPSGIVIDLKGIWANI